MFVSGGDFLNPLVRIAQHRGGNDEDEAQDRCLEFRMQTPAEAAWKNTIAAHDVHQPAGLAWMESPEVKPPTMKTMLMMMSEQFDQ